MRCTPKKTLQQIIECGHDYLVAVKANQPKLLAHLQAQFAQYPPQSYDWQPDHSRDRQVERSVSVLDHVTGIDPKWTGVQRLIKVERSGKRGRKSLRETVFYVSSLSLDAAGFAQRIRNHWHVENRLHWVKDVVLQEDSAPLCDGNAIVNFAIVRTIVLNLFRTHGFDSITQGIRRVAHDIPTLFSFLQ